MYKVNVLQIGKYYHPVKGGIEDHLHNLCNELKNSCELRVVVANDTPRTVKDNVDNISVTRLPKFGELSNIPICPTMPIRLKSFSADIVHLHLPNPMAHLSYLIAKPKGTLVIMWHSDIIGRDFFIKFYKPFLMTLLYRAERIIATSPAYVRHSLFLSRFKDKTVVIPLGINLSRFALTKSIQDKVAQIRESFGNRIALYVGRLTYYKGLEYLIKAMEDVEANLIIVGDGRLKRKLKVLAHNSRSKDKIWFMGEVSHEDIVSYFHACDVFVLPSVERSEAFGIVQLEAMACRKPVVSTDLKTGVPWVNQNGKSGIVVPPRDPGSLAKAINTLLDNHALRQKYGDYGRERVEREFTKELVAEKVITLYREILRTG